MSRRWTHGSAGRSRPLPKRPRTYCRIHGTTDPSSIGKAASNGCIHMTNDQVVELYDLVPVGTKVVVLDPTSTFSPRS
ncbi:L,D-transpeptidase [Phyllobacterium bourgognense]|uniref:L,D-transpeptidase n=1 Tax=Phyllobacterium bourgognense TaxID=314236 RepID=UPI001FDF409D